MYNLLGLILMAGITFPVSFWVARTCLNGVLRAMTGSQHRDAL